MTVPLWRKHLANPIPHPTINYSGCVFKEGNTWYSYYWRNDGGTWKIFRATSSDGISFSNEQLIMAPRSGKWDSTHVHQPIIFKEDGVYKMIYTGQGAGGWAIGLATSNDGVNWTRYDSPILTITETWEGSNIENWGIIKHEGVYYLWYCTVSAPRKIGLAYGTNLFSLTKDSNNPLFYGGGASGRFIACPFKFGGKFYLALMCYTSGTDYSQCELYRCSNPKFYPADREYLGVINVCGSSGSWDYLDSDNHWIVTKLDPARDDFSDTYPKIRAYYSGDNGTQVRVGIVEHDNIYEALDLPQPPSEQQGASTQQTVLMLSDFIVGMFLWTFYIYILLPKVIEFTKELVKWKR